LIAVRSTQPNVLEVYIPDTVHDVTIVDREELVERFS